MNQLKSKTNSSNESKLLSKTSTYTKDLKENNSSIVINDTLISFVNFENPSNKKTINSVEEIMGNRYLEKNKNEINIIKRRILNMLKNENIEVGYSSMTELYLEKLLKQDVYKLKEILSLLQVENFDKPEILQKLIEVMSNLEYKTLYPTNTIIALSFINHVDIGVQEAAIAAFEKWDDKSNVNLLRNINYTASWIETYANDVIQYLEGC